LVNGELDNNLPTKAFPEEVLKICKLTWADINADKSVPQKGIPSFFLKGLLHSDFFGPIINENDKFIMEHLVNVKVEQEEGLFVRLSL